MRFNVGTAFKYLEQAPVGTLIEHTPKGVKNCKVFYRKTSSDSLEKIVDRADGTKFTSQFSGQTDNYQLTECVAQNSKGKIKVGYNTPWHKKVTQIDIPKENGTDYFVRYEQYSPEANFNDIDYSANNKFGNLSEKYNSLIKYIMGT
ncbi:MAG: hypothetical protein NC408_09745 [Candidatus Gastranaerophilales bacterium]|nr:hypothetical protein [Candidatus Gastranaerophilales bacterium]MCM1072850.1 hypothetical protein [Bacteroides sp.]